MKKIRSLYATENLSIAKPVVMYEPHSAIDYSLNKGDYMQPNWSPIDGFHVEKNLIRFSYFDFVNDLTNNNNKNNVLEEIIPGRRAAIFVNLNDDRSVPIVRSSTKYTNPPYLFTDTMHQLLKDGHVTNETNNIMFEVYDKRYKTMKMHSDLDLDLSMKHPIQILSLFEHPEQDDGTRALIVQDKVSGDTATIPLLHGTIVSFSRKTNAKTCHRIVHQPKKGETENGCWLGLTMRVSDRTNKQDEFELNDTEIYRLCKLRRESCDVFIGKSNHTVNKADFLTPQKLDSK